MDFLLSFRSVYACMIDHAPFLNFGETYSTNSSDTKNSPSSKYVKSIHLKEMISMCSKFFESPSNKQIHALEQGRSYTFQNEGAARGLGADQDSKWRLFIDHCTSGGMGFRLEGSIPSPPPLATPLNLRLWSFLIQALHHMHSHK